MSRLLGTRHERSTARDGLLVCSGRMTAASTPRAVGRSRGAFVSLLLGTRHERSTARDGLMVCSGRMTATSTPRAVGRSRGAFVSHLLGTRHERSTAREMVHRCSEADVSAQTISRAVDRSCRVPSRRLTKAPRERPTARGVLVAVIRPLHTKRPSRAAGGSNQYVVVERSTAHDST